MSDLVQKLILAVEFEGKDADLKKLATHINKFKGAKTCYIEDITYIQEGLSEDMESLRVVLNEISGETNEAS